MSKKVAIVGDSFADRYFYGNVERVSPEAPVPILDIEDTEIRAGGAANVANNLYSLGVDLTLFTIFGGLKLPYEVVSPRGATPLKKDRYIAKSQQILRVDNPKYYLKEDVNSAEYPTKKDFDVIAFVDYNKGMIKGGSADIVDSKKQDLSVFEGSKFLKINSKEFYQAVGKETFSYWFVTKSKDGISYYENGKIARHSEARAREIVDITGAGDTVMAVLIYCLANEIDDRKVMMKLANKAAGIVISKFGTSTITKDELFN